MSVSIFRRQCDRRWFISLFCFFQLHFMLVNGNMSGHDLFSSRKSSLFKIDPKKIVSKMVTYSGLILPDSIERDVKIINSVCNCDRASLDVVNREIEVLNFTVNLPDPESQGDDDTLRIGRCCLRWDSYFKPCVEIEIEDIDICVEFLNVLLTKNNWGMLQKHGFPPKLYNSTYSEDVTDKSTFLRIGSIDLRGEVKLRIKSRPLQQNLCQDLVLDLKMLKDLNEDIHAATEEMSDGRRGCTTEELYKIIELHFAKKLKSILKATAFDVLRGQVSPDTESQTIRHARNAFVGTKDNVAKYVNDAKETTIGQVEKKLSRKLEEWGFDASTVDLMKSTNINRKNRETRND